MASQAANLIAQLEKQGYSRSAIGRAIGRDPSIISQIAKGKKSGASYVPALESLSRGATSVNVERRKTKAGKQARVRKGAIRDAQGKVIHMDTKTPNGAQVTNTLKQAEKNNGRIGVVVTFRRYQAYEMPIPASMDIPLWSNGTSAKWINQQLRSGMTFSQLVTSQVKAAYDPTIAEDVAGVQLNVVY